MIGGWNVKLSDHMTFWDLIFFLETGYHCTSTITSQGT